MCDRGWATDAEEEATGSATASSRAPAEEKARAERAERVRALKEEVSVVAIVSWFAGEQDGWRGWDFSELMR